MRGEPDRPRRGADGATGRRQKVQRILILIGILVTFAGFVPAPLLILAVPALLVGLARALKNVRADMAWCREWKVAREQALREIHR